jgi:hypothetical protein
VQFNALEGINKPTSESQTHILLTNISVVTVELPYGEPVARGPLPVWADFDSVTEPKKF